MLELIAFALLQLSISSASSDASTGSRPANTADAPTTNVTHGAGGWSDDGIHGAGGWSDDG